MTLADMFKAARDITPAFGVLTTVRNGKTVLIPTLDRYAGALFIAEDQGTHVDVDGRRWLVGTQGGQFVKRRLD